MHAADLGFQNKGAVCFLLGFLLQACSSVCTRVPAFDVEHANVRLRHPLAEQPGQKRKERHEDGRGKKRRNVFFPFQSAFDSWLF